MSYVLQLFGLYTRDITIAMCICVQNRSRTLQNDLAFYTAKHYRIRLLSEFLANRWAGHWERSKSRAVAYRKEAGGPTAQRHWQHIVEHVHVLAEAVEHAADGRAVEEADGGSAQHAAQHRRVQRARSRQRPQVQRQGRHRHRHHCTPRLIIPASSPGFSSLAFLDLPSVGDWRARSLCFEN